MNEEIKGNENNSSVTDQAEQGQTFTEADVERRVTQAVKTTEARMEKLFNERLKSTVQEQLSEAQKMQSMDERDRELYTIQKENEELRAKQSEYIKAQNLNSATQVLTNRNLPPALAKYLITDDAEQTLANIGEVEAMLNDWYSGKVRKDILPGKTPRGSAVNQSSLTREAFNRMTLEQQSELYRTNPTLYRAMTER